MKKGDIFINPNTNKTCEVTRFYGNKSWYYKEVGANKEVRSTIESSKIQISSKTNTIQYFDTMAKIETAIEEYKPIPSGARVKIDVEELFKSKFNCTEVFDNFVIANKNTIFTVRSSTPHIVSLEETLFTFWEKHLIVVESIEN